MLSTQLFNLPRNDRTLYFLCRRFYRYSLKRKGKEGASVLASHTADVSVWAEKRSLEISAQKTTVTLFTPQTQKAYFHTTVRLNGSPLPFDWNPKILRVTFDPLFNFHKHVDN